MFSLLNEWRRLRRRIKDQMPYVRRRVYRALRIQDDGLSDAVHAHAMGAAPVPLQVRKPVPAGLAGEVCLFVTHAASPRIKGHVLHHMDHLLRAGVQVVLIVNTDLPAESIEVDPDVAARLAGLYVRLNRGFDFGAWCHVLQQCDWSGWHRLYLVNDSIVGPIDAAQFDAMLARIRASEADAVGLVECPDPIPHLQSFFLAFGPRVLASPLFAGFVRGVINFPDKAHVIQIYELRLTRSLRQAGFRCESLFPNRVAGGRSADVHHGWHRLVGTGFPYVKTRVLQDMPEDPRVQMVRARAAVDAQI